MAKQNMIDTAKELETQAQSLFERIKKTQDALGETLNAIRGAEGRLTEKEQQAAKERAERERAERLGSCWSGRMTWRSTWRAG